MVTFFMALYTRKKASLMVQSLEYQPSISFGVSVSRYPRLRNFWVVSPFENVPPLIKRNNVQHLIAHSKIILVVLILREIS